MYSKTLDSLFGTSCAEGLYRNQGYLVSHKPGSQRSTQLQACTCFFLASTLPKHIYTIAEGPLKVRAVG